MVVGSFAKRSRKESVALSHSIRENLLDIKAQHKADKQVPVAYAWTGTEFWESGAQTGEGALLGRGVIEMFHRLMWRWAYTRIQMHKIVHFKQTAFIARKLCLKKVVEMTLMIYEVQSNNTVNV